MHEGEFILVFCVFPVFVLDVERRLVAMACICYVWGKVIVPKIQRRQGVSWECRQLFANIGSFLCNWTNVSFCRYIACLTNVCFVFLLAFRRQCVWRRCSRKCLGGKEGRQRWKARRLHSYPLENARNCSQFGRSNHFGSAWTSRVFETLSGDACVCVLIL
jgi:hypothetical protein